LKEKIGIPGVGRYWPSYESIERLFIIRHVSVTQFFPNPKREMQFYPKREKVPYRNYDSIGLLNSSYLTGKSFDFSKIPDRKYNYNFLNESRFQFVKIPKSSSKSKRYSNKHREYVENKITKNFFV